MCKGNLDGTHFKNGGVPLGGGQFSGNSYGVPLRNLIELTHGLR